jgi:prophage antirepressor-like protein
MNEIQIFDNPQFGSVRTITEGETVLFCGSDVASVLGYQNTRDALSRHCRGVVKRDILTTSGEQEMSFIPEGDVYRLIVRSNLPAAESFERWVFDEVLPSIRKNGMWAKDELLDNPDLLIEVATKLKEERAARKALEAEKAKLLPKAEFCDAVMDSKDAIPIGAVAKVLTCGLGQNRLFAFLRDKGILMQNNLPYQKYVDEGWFRCIESKYDVRGETRIYLRTVVFQKGVRKIRELILTQKESTEEEQ